MIPRKRASRIYCFAQAWLLFLAFMMPGVLRAQPQNEAPPPTPQPRQPVDFSAATEIPLRPIYFWESQAPKLLPRNYWPVYLDELLQALERQTQVAEPGTQRPLLSNAFYVATYDDGSLISEPDGSLLNIIYESDTPGSLNLGPVTLALDDSASISRSDSSRLVTLPNGDLKAIVARDGRIRFGWSRKGIPTADGRQVFDLQIPVCGRTRLLIGIPDDYRLDSDDGVVTRLPSPPPEAAGTTTERANLWYSIEAGGLARLRLSIGRVTPQRTTRRKLALRAQGSDVRLSTSSTDWTTRLDIDIPRGAALPSLLLSSGYRLTSVQFDGEPLRWRESDADEGTEIRWLTETVKAPLDERVTNGRLTHALELTGTGPVFPFRDDNNTPNPASMAPNADASTRDEATPLTPLPTLPWVRFAGPDEVLHCADQSVILRVDEPLRVASFANANTSSWRVDRLPMSSDAERSDYQFTGPASMAPPTPRIVIPEQTATSHAALLLALDEGQIRAEWRSQLQFSQAGAQPILFELEPGWSVESISLGESQRPAELPEIGQESNTFQVWPEPDDFSQNALRVTIRGTRRQTNELEANTFEPTWFVRADLARLQTIAVIKPRANYLWPPNTALTTSLRNAEGLAEPMRNLLPEGDVRGSLILETDGRATPKLTLSPPPADFSSQLALQFDLRDQRIVEHLAVRIRVPSQGVPPVRLSLGPTMGRPPMQWAKYEDSDGVLTADSFRARRLESTGSDGETWEITADELAGETLVFYGERQYPAQLWETSDALSSASSNAPVAQTAGSTVPKITLPNISVAFAGESTRHRGTVRVGPGLSLHGMSSNVLKLPVGGSVREPIEVEASLAANPELAPLSESSSPGWLLRYAPDQLAFVQMTKTDTPRGPPLVVWHQHTRCMAGMTGDLIVTDFDIDRRAPFTVKFDPGMTIRRISGGTYTIPPRSPGEIRVTPDRTASSVRVEWWRNVKGSWRYRSFEPPELEVDGLVVRGTCSVWPSVDAIPFGLGDPEAPPSLMLAETRPHLLRLDASESLILLNANFALALAVAGALLVFAMGAVLIPRFIVLGLGVLAMATAFALFTPPWATPTLAFVILPWAAAGLATSRWPHLRGNIPGGTADTSPPSHRSHSAGSRQGSTRRHPTLEAHSPDADPRASTVIRKDASSAGAQPLRGWWWLALALTSGTSLVYAQERPASSTDKAPRKPVEVLIPLTADGELAGREVYVPKSLKYGLLRQPTSDDSTGELEFLSAEYQTRIIPIGMGDSADEVNVEATWRVSIESIDLPVRLPIPPEHLDRLELITDAAPNEIRPIPDGDGVLIRLPRSGVSLLRATLSPPAELTVAGANRLELAIPPVATASLSITSDSPFEQINLPNCRGQLLRSSSGNRVNAQLGSIDRLELIWQRRTATAAGRWSDVSRRWRVEASPQTITREVELELGEGVRAGVVVDLVANISELPVVTSSDWSLTSSDTSEIQRSRLRMIARVDAPGPLRLLWSAPSRTLNLASIPLPDVRPASLRSNLPTSVGVKLARDWSVTEFVTEDAAEPATEPVTLQPEEFSDAWQGFGAVVDVARAYANNGPSGLRLVRPNPSRTTATVTHRVTVRPQQLETQYTCRLSLGESDTQPLTLQLPPGMQFHRLRVNDETIQSVLLQHASHDQTEVLLPAFDSDSPIEIELEALMPLDANANFRLPRVVLTGTEILSSELHLLRSHRLRIETPLADDAAVGLQPIALGVEHELAEGLIPVASWRLDTNSLLESPWLGPPRRARIVAPQLNTASLTTLRWNDGLWTSEGLFEIDLPEQPTDFLTLEIPTRWEQGLNIEPAIKWFIEPSTSPGRSLIRVLHPALIRAPDNMALPTDEDAVAANSVDSDSRENPDTAGASLLAGSTAENPENQPIRLRITSALENAGDGGVAVPDIRLLSQGTHRRFFATPKRLTNNPVTWQTQNARILDAAQIPFDVQATTPTHVFYEVVGETFTANLQPNSGGAEAARIPLVELDLFPENTATAIGLMRVHLIPGDRDTLPVELPPDAEPLGAWAGGIPVEMRRFEDGRLEIPVGISRLVQPMTLLVRLAVPADEASDVLIPRITAIPVSTTWCARYDDRSHRLGRVIIEEPADDSPQSFAEVPAASLREARELLESAAPSGTWQTVGVSTYRQQLAESIADLLDSVADSVSERPSSEKQFWLRPWFARLQQLRWASLDDWAPRLMQRVFGSEATSMDGLALAGLPQSMVSPAGWIPTRVVRQTGPASAIPRGLIPQQSNPLERWAGVALSAAIALGFCITILVMRWLFRIDLTLRPHLWLGLVGLALLTLLPSPVGLTAITLSMVLPLIERWR